MGSSHEASIHSGNASSVLLSVTSGSFHSETSNGSAIFATGSADHEAMRHAGRSSVGSVLATVALADACPEPADGPVFQFALSASERAPPMTHKYGVLSAAMPTVLSHSRPPSPVSSRAAEPRVPIGAADSHPVDLGTPPHPDSREPVSDLLEARSQ